MREMFETNVKWQTIGAHTVITCFETGNHYAVREFNLQSREMTLVGRAFDETTALELYTAAVSAKMNKTMEKQDAAAAAAILRELCEQEVDKSPIYSGVDSSFAEFDNRSQMDN